MIGRLSSGLDHLHEAIHVAGRFLDRAQQFIAREVI